jgi:hypothetical protein
MDNNSIKIVIDKLIIIVRFSSFNISPMNYNFHSNSISPIKKISLYLYLEISLI